MKYHTFSVFVEIDGVAKFMDVVGCSIDAVLADISEAFQGEVICRQWGQR